MRADAWVFVACLGCAPTEEPLDCGEDVWHATCAEAIERAMAWGAAASAACDPSYPKEEFNFTLEEHDDVCNEEGWYSGVCAASQSGASCFYDVYPLYYTPGPECDTGVR